MLNRRVLKTLALLAGASIYSAVAWAAGAEVSGYGGGSWSNGGDLTTISGLKGGSSGAFGGAAGVKLGTAHVLAEFGYATVASGSNSGIGVTQRTVDFGAAFYYGFGSSEKVTPYVAADLGIAHGSATFSAAGASANTGDGNQLYAGVGGGLRFFVGHSWGLKPEVMFRRYRSDGINTITYGLGVFYDFGK